MAPYRWPLVSTPVGVAPTVALRRDSLPTYCAEPSRPGWPDAEPGRLGAGPGGTQIAALWDDPMSGPYGETPPPRITAGDYMMMPAGVKHVSAAAPGEDCIEFITQD
ncbi:MAG: hypothetical protein H0U28_07410, partial [Nocardioidaceae bacterium]|nr:hypothetical protein [Nocardioidaceae bacterium]